MNPANRAHIFIIQLVCIQMNPANRAHMYTNW